MKSIKIQIFFILLFFSACGFDPDSFNNIGIKPLQSKFVALPLIEGTIELEQLLSREDRPHLNRSTVPWLLEYKNWETEAQKDTITPLILGQDILEDDYFVLQTGIVIPTLSNLQDIIINSSIILPLRVDNTFFDINVLKVKEGYYEATYINKYNQESNLSIEVIQYKTNDTVSLYKEEYALIPNLPRKVIFGFNNINVTKVEGYTTALKIQNSHNGVDAPFTIDLNEVAEIVIKKVDGIHFTPFVDVNIPFKINEKALYIDVFDNSLEKGGVTLSNIELKIVSFNTFGLDIITGEIEVLAQSSIDSSLTPILFQEHQITKPIKVGEERVDTLFIQKPDAVLKKKPNKVIMKGNLNLNMKTGVNYFIESDSYIKEQFILTIPFEVGLQDVIFSTTLTLEDNLQEGISFLDSTIFKLEFNNYFPLDASLSIYALNNTTDETPYLIDLNPEVNTNEVILLESAILDSDKKVVAPTKVKTSFRLTNEDAQRMIDAELIYIEGKFNTPNGEVVPFVPEQRLFMKAGIVASVKLSPNDL